jgi:hypothetical protein
MLSYQITGSIVYTSPSLIHRLRWTDICTGIQVLFYLQERLAASDYVKASQARWSGDRSAVVTDLAAGVLVWRAGNFFT